MEIFYVYKKIVLLSLFSFFAQGLSAEKSSNEFSNEVELLKNQIHALTERLDRMEKKREVKKNIKLSKENQKKHSMLDGLSFKADFRNRYEIIDQEGNDSRERNRIRLRAVLNMQIDQDLSFALGVATGGNNPVSTNQTLGDGASSKDIRLDLAVFNYQLNQKASLWGGKMKNPFYRAGKNMTFWDGDLNPEGLALKMNGEYLQSTLVALSLDERKTAQEALMIGGQVMHTFPMDDSAELIAGIGYYDYSGVEGFEPVYDGEPRGNTIDEDGNLANDFNIVEGFLEYKTKLAGKSFSLYANYFQNTAVDEFDTSYTIGVKIGKVKGAGSWGVGLSYINSEADSVVALYNDSDFAGGNTGSKGFSLRAGYGIKKNISFALTYINSEFGQSLVTQTDYKRLNLDLRLKFN